MDNISQAIKDIRTMFKTGSSNNWEWTLKFKSGKTVNITQDSFLNEGLPKMHNIRIRQIERKHKSGYIEIYTKIEIKKIGEPVKDDILLTSQSRQESSKKGKVRKNKTRPIKVAETKNSVEQESRLFQTLSDNEVEDNKLIIIPISNYSRLERLSGNLPVSNIMYKGKLVGKIIGIDKIEIYNGKFNTVLQMKERVSHAHAKQWVKKMQKQIIEKFNL